MATDLKPPSIYLSPPEIMMAENGFVVKSYDIHTDQFRYVICADVGELRSALTIWVAGACRDIERAAEYRLKSAIGEKRDAVTAA